MEEIILKAMPRSEKPKAARNAGFIPGVLNGPGTTSATVKFDSSALNKIIAKHGTNAKLWVVSDDDKKFGFIKEIQRHPVEGKVIHIAIQLVSKDQDVKMQLPITFRGHGDLEHRMLQLQVYRPEIEAEGKAEYMPDEAVVDVSEKQYGETVTAIDFHLPAGIKITDPEDEIYAVIKASREDTVDKPEVVKAAE